MSIGLILCLFGVACFSCGSDLENALEQADGNRKELEKVLEYYKNDSLKYKAACFLIENMPGHFSYGGSVYENFHRNIDTTLRDLAVQDKTKKLEEIFQTYRDSLVVLEDIKVITASYLIANIDSAFGAWQNKPWAEHVGFDDFCEYILPYKAVNLQPFEDWRKEFCNSYEQYMGIVRKLDQYQNSAYWACTYVNMNLRSDIHFNSDHAGIDLSMLLPSSLVKLGGGNCEAFALIGANVMRAKGIPVAIDFTPQWPFRSLGHCWNVVLANSGKNVVFSGIDSDPGIPHKPDEKMAKVFRRTYAINRELLELNQREESVPFVFKDYFMKDVTCEYMVTSDVEIRPFRHMKHKGNYAYLAVFDNQQWVPVQWAGVRNGKAVFKNMGRNIVYLPVYYTKNGILPMAHPFLLDLKGKVNVLEADTTRGQTMIVERKYPVSKAAYEMGMRLVGGKIQVADHEDFRDARTLYQIPEWCNAGCLEIAADSAWRYWRYFSPRYGFGNISEIIFLQRDSCLPVKGRFVGSEPGFSSDKPDSQWGKAFDGNPLTFFSAKDANEAWVGMDFGESLQVGRILYWPRTDGNMIQYGDTYELYWWNRDGWKLFGKPRLARHIFLEYRDVPQNALFCLRDVDRGKEKRIFTCKDGKQVWW